MNREIKKERLDKIRNKILKEKNNDVSQQRFIKMLWMIDANFYSFMKKRKGLSNERLDILEKYFEKKI